MDDLDVFLTIVEEGSQTAAARRLGRTLQSVNRALARLERGIGVELVRRTTRRSVVTEAGMAFYERVRPAVAEIAEAWFEAGERRARPRGLLRIGAPTAFATRFVVPAIRAFQERFPDVDIALSVADRQVDILAEGLDLAIRIRRLPDSSLLARRLGEIRIVTYAARPYLERYGRPQRPEDLKDHRCLLREGLEDAWSFQVSGNAVSVPVSGHLSINEVHAINAAVAAGLGIHQGPYWHVSEEIEHGDFEVVLENFEPPPLPIQATFPPSRLTPAKTRLFIDALVEQLRNNGIPA